MRLRHLISSGSSLTGFCSCLCKQITARHHAIRSHWYSTQASSSGLGGLTSSHTPSHNKSPLSKPVNVLPLCPIVNHSGKPAKFERNRKIIEWKLNQLQKGQALLAMETQPEYIALDGHERGFYLSDEFYRFPAKAMQPMWHTCSSMIFWYRQIRPHWRKLFPSLQESGLAAFVSVTRNVATEDWESLGQLGLIHRPELLVPRLRTAVEGLPKARRQLLNVKRRDVMALPGLHQDYTPPHQWPTVQPFCFAKDTDSSGAVCAHVHLQAIYQKDLVQSTWPFAPEGYPARLPKYIHCYLRLRTEQLSEPVWKVADVNYVVLP
jgi:hypothetical protein